MSVAVQNLLNNLKDPMKEIKKNQQPLDAYTTEKFISVLVMTSDILGKEEVT
jgi:hypothetical protein